MKKKRYTTPQLLIVRVESQTQILTGSPGILVSTDYADEDEEVLSRGSGFWDDDY